MDERISAVRGGLVMSVLPQATECAPLGGLCGTGEDRSCEHPVVTCEDLRLRTSELESSVASPAQGVGYEQSRASHIGSR